MHPLGVRQVIFDDFTLRPCQNWTNGKFLADCRQHANSIVTRITFISPVTKVDSGRYAITCSTSDGFVNTVANINFSVVSTYYFVIVHVLQINLKNKINLNLKFLQNNEAILIFNIFYIYQKKIFVIF